MKSKAIVISVLALSLLIGSTPVFAREGEDDSDKSGAVSKLQRTVEETVQTTEDTATGAVEKTRETVREKVQSQKEQIETRKSELQEKLRANESERKEKLEGRRLAQCQNRQDSINDLMDKSVDIGREKLARIQRYEEGIKAFYTTNNLSIDSYGAAVQTVDEKEATAIAALDTVAAQEFDCMTIDGATPSGTIRDSHEMKREALKEYRDSVKSLLEVVKKAFLAKSEEVSDAE